MSNLTLAPEDDSDFSLPQKSRSSASTRLEQLHLRFSLKKVGFGIISPRPGLDQMLEVSGNGMKLADMSQDEKEQQ
jgi:hypothetical protein